MFNDFFFLFIKGVKENSKKNFVILKECSKKKWEHEMVVFFPIVTNISEGGKTYLRKTAPPAVH